MIKSFRDKETEKIWNGKRSRRLPVEIQKPAFRKLILIDAAENVEELRIPPGNRLKKLSGDRSGQMSIRIDRQWRICFEFKSGDFFNVEITDYH